MSIVQQAINTIGGRIMQSLYLRSLTWLKEKWQKKVYCLVQTAQEKPITHKSLGTFLQHLILEHPYEQIKEAIWFDRELRAFDLYNAEKNLCDELMLYPFADWLINASCK